MTAPSRSTSDSDLVKVVYAHDQTEAVFVQGLLRLSSPRPKNENPAGMRDCGWRDPDSNRGHHDFQS